MAVVHITNETFEKEGMLTGLLYENDRASYEQASIPSFSIICRAAAPLSCGS